MIEAYLPDASQRDDDWFRRLVDRASASLAPYSLEVGLLVLPEDETALWLISSADHAITEARIPGELDLVGLIAVATAFAGGHVMEGQMVGRLVRRDDARP